ncbi:MAG: ATP-binding protein [Pseudomonadales bacterium]
MRFTADLKRRLSLRNHSPLASKLLKVVLSIYLLVAITMTVMQLGLEYENEQARLEAELNQIAEAFSPVLAADLWNVDVEQVEATMQGIWVNPAIWKAEVVDDTGISIAKLSRRSARYDVQPWELPWIERQYHVHLRSEADRESYVGSLTLASNAYVVFGRAMSTFAITVINAFIKTLVLWLIFYFALVRIVARPLEQLTNAIRRINPSSASSPELRSQNLSELHTADELGVLAASFTELESALIEKNETIADRQAHLESTVVALEHASQAKSTFLAHMSHELRTPLNGVLGMIEVLSGTPLDERQTRYLSTLETSGKHLLSVINSVLDFSKLESGKVELESIDFHLESLLEDCIETFRPLAAEKHIDLFHSIDTDSIRFVRGDASKLKQVLNNLIDNAIKFTATGQVELKVSCKQQDQGVAASFSVIDSGIGMTKQQQQSLFQAFSQGDRSTTRKYGGTGLGLVICRQLIELMEGSITCDSKPSVGTTFSFEVHLGVANPLVQAEPLTAPEPLDFSHLRVLVAEDNPVNQLVIKGLLGKLGVQPAIADTGLAAVQAWEQAEEPFDIIFMDIEMPEMDGWTATRQLRSQCDSAEAPRIIGLSAHALDIDADLARERGMDAYLSKPIKLESLQETLSDMAQKAQTVRTAPGKQR